MLKAQALANQLSVSAYVDQILDEADLKPCPSLAALGALVSLHATVAASRNITDEQLCQLKKLVMILSAAARKEASAL